MARVDLQDTDEEIGVSKIIKAIVILTMKQINQLRALHGLPAFTKAQVVAALKQEIRDL